MEKNGTADDILILDNALIFDTEPGGESAIEFESDVLLLTNALAPEPVVKKIDVGPRISSFESRDSRAKSVRAHNPRKSEGWNIMPPTIQSSGRIKDTYPAPTSTAIMDDIASNLRAPNEAVQPKSGDIQPMNLAQLLAEARAFATDYYLMNARTRKALYAALGRTYDISFYADGEPETYLRLIEEAGLTVQDRAPYTPIIKLVFGADYDKTRIAEFAAAMVYGRRKNLPVGSFSEFLDTFDGGLKAIVSLERLMRHGEDRTSACSERNEARPALARKLRTISLQTWGDISSEGDEFALLMARRLPDGSIAVVGEVPRDIALIEKAGRKLLANLGQSDRVQNA